jgi:N-acyl-D-aspartate/D-glutamate deacylase
MMFDTLIRNASIVDGTGADAFDGDVAIAEGRIAAVGRKLGRAHREIDAEGRLVTPGWVDIHSHYDGQAMWDPLMSPSGGHGVTTTVMGNCGVGFAPVRPGDHEALITLMEGVEDIPGSALAEGLAWNWESFPEYLDCLAAIPRVMDVGALIPHSAVRAYVMGAHPSIRGRALPEQLARMEAIVREGIAAGALGLSTSRTKLHLGADGSPVPGSFVEIEELLALGHAVRGGGGGMLQLVTDWSDDPTRETDWITHLSDETGQPLSVTLAQFEETPRHHEAILSAIGRARDAGIAVNAGVASRPVGMLINLESRIHPFSHHPSFAAIAELPLAAKLAQMRDPGFRARLLAEEAIYPTRFWQAKMRAFDNMFALGNPPDYEPAPEASVEAQATLRGCMPHEILYDILCSASEEWIYFPFINYADRSLAPQLEMMRHPAAVLSLADGGAHCGLICDASAPTFLLAHWVKHRSRGPRLTLAEAVHMQTGRPANLWGLRDRGQLIPGMRADISIIDFDRLALCPPYWAADLPAGGRRLLQDARGYCATFVDGQMTWSDGEPTGARPGRLIRGGGSAAMP